MVSGPRTAGTAERIHEAAEGDDDHAALYAGR